METQCGNMEASTHLGGNAVYQSDLGDKTKELASAIEAYNPDSRWEKVE